MTNSTNTIALYEYSVVFLLLFRKKKKNEMNIS